MQQRIVTAVVYLNFILRHEYVFYLLVFIALWIVPNIFIKFLLLSYLSYFYLIILFSDPEQQKTFVRFHKSLPDVR